MAKNSQLEILIRAQDAFSGTFGKLNSELGKTKTLLSSVSMAMGALGVGIGVSSLISLAKESANLGMEFDEAKSSFDRLAASSGRNSNLMLAQLRKASQGMTSDLELVKSANRALLTDSQVVIDNLTTAYQAAAISSDALGVSVSEAFDRITKSVSSMQSRGLKEFGITFDQTAAMDAYAASIDKVASELTQAEQETAFALAAFAEMRDLIERSGEAGLSAGDNLDIFRAAIENLKTSIGTLTLQTGLADYLGDAGYAIQFYTNAFTVHQKALNALTDGSVSGITKAIALEAEFLRLQALLGTDAQAAAEGLAELATGFTDVELSGAGAAGAIDGVTAAVIDLNRQLGAVGARNYAAAVYGGVSNAPSATMFGGSPAQYGYANKTLGQQEQVVAEYNERQAEAARRKSEYQSRYNEQLREELALIDSIRSRAESVLTGGVNVTQQDMLDTAAGSYMDKPLEAARRLADIAANGMASPWAKVLVPPPEVIAAGEAAVKAWAERTKQDVIDLTRPDLINWDAFISNYQDALNRESMKESTLDLAMSKLSEAGLLKGADKNKVAEMLGLDTPQSTGELFASGFAEGLANKDMANLFLSAWQTDFDGKKSEYELAGKNLGGVIITGLSTAVKDNMPNVRQEIAYYIAPEVAKILAQKDGSKP